MSSSHRRRFAPQTRQFLERQIVRRYTRFDKGMFRQRDCEGSDIPDGGVADLINCRAVGDALECRPGTLLYTPADYAVSGITNGQTLTQAIATDGDLYVAKGAAPAAGDVFLLTSAAIDFAGGELATAKGSATRDYDCFELTAVDTPAVLYLGRVLRPAIPGYGDTIGTEITASRSSAGVITATAGPAFTADHVGNFFRWGDGQRDFITGFTDGTHVTTRRLTAKTSTVRCILQGRMNASLYHKGANRVVALFGDRIYVNNGLPPRGWTEVPILGRAAPINTADTEIFQDGDDAILANPGGLFRVRLGTDQLYAYKINAVRPTVKLTAVGVNAERKDAYSYTYTLARLSGGSYYDDPFDADTTVEVELETGSVKPDSNNIDYADIWATAPVGDGLTTYGLLTGTALDAAQKVNSGWNTVADGTFVLNFGSPNVAYQISVDLTGVETIADVAYKLQAAIRQYEDLDKVEVLYDTDHFVVKTGESDTLTYVTAGSGGTDISARLKLTEAAAAVVSNPMFTSKLLVGSLTIPTSADGSRDETHQLTHYGVYRSKNIAKNPDDRWRSALVRYVPFAKAFHGYADAGMLNLSQGRLHESDIGCTVTTEAGASYTISSVLNEGTALLSGSPTFAATSLAIGGGTVLTAYQDGLTVTIASGKSLTSADEGKAIFWADGRISHLVSVTGAGTAVAAFSESHGSSTSNMAATMDPVSRSFSDNVRDDKLTPRLSGFPLRTRYMEPLPDGDVANLAPGFLLVGVRGAKEFHYCDTAYRWTVGSHNRVLQKTEDVWDGLQDLVVKDGYVVIVGAVNTYKQSTTDFMQVGETAVGESVSKLSPMKEIAKHGCVGNGGRQALDNTNDIVITSEPAVRVFDGGASYGENLAAKRIQKSDLVKFKRAWVTGYHPQLGFIIWGVQEA